MVHMPSLILEYSMPMRSPAAPGLTVSKHQLGKGGEGWGQQRTRGEELWGRGPSEVVVVRLLVLPLILSISLLCPLSCSLPLPLYLSCFIGWKGLGEQASIVRRQSKRELGPKRQRAMAVYIG